jgi:predicted RecB family nuclease
VRRITGTHVYAYAKCPRLAALDLHLDRALRREPSPWEEFAARRGREFEADYVRDLGAVQPQYPERDFAAGAQATLALLREGAPLIHQAVLAHGDRLGLPDLLRRVDGSSAIGDHHYEVLDVKTSGRARADQVLQVVFYSRLLADVQGRLPVHGALVLKDRREERFAVADYRAVGAEVEAELVRLRAAPEAARPFRQRGCDSCHWNHRCLPELAAARDLSLVQGMSHGAREILEAHGCRTIDDLAVFVDGGRLRHALDPALLRRLRRAAQAALLGQPLVEPRPHGAALGNRALGDGALVHLLGDPFADRVLAIGVQHPLGADDGIAVELPRSRDAEWPAFRRLLDRVPPQAVLLHFDHALPRWYEEHAHRQEAGVGIAARFVELQRRLRAAALFPAPVFALADFVAHGLGRDPLRAGHPGAAALWAAAGDGDRKLVAKVTTDLHDLAALERRILAAAPAAQEQALGSDAGTATA